MTKKCSRVFQVQTESLSQSKLSNLAQPKAAKLFFRIPLSRTIEMCHLAPSTVKNFSDRIHFHVPGK